MWRECGIIKNLKFRILLFLEAVLLVSGLIGIIRGDYTAVGISDMVITQHAGEQVSEGWYIDGSAEFNGEYLTAAGFELNPGVYKLKIYYEALDNPAGSYEIISEEGYFNNLLSNGVTLYSGESESCCQFYLLDKTDKLRVAVNYLAAQGMTVKNLEIIHTAAGARILVFLTLLFSALLNYLVCLHSYMGNHEVSRDKLLVGFGIPLLAVIASIPLFTDYMIVGADSYFHWLRIEALSHSLRNLEIPVRLESIWLYGHGYANSIFYSDTFLVLPALLRLVGFPMLVSYGFYVFIVNLATAGIAYISFKGCFKNCYVGMAGSMLYTLAPYRIYNIYNRTAVGEYTAMTFLPLLCYGFYLIFTEDTTKKRYRYYWMIPVLGFSGLIQSHVLSCEIVGAFTILLCMIMFKRVFCKKVFLELCKVVAGTAALNLWFLLPLLDMMVSGEYRYSLNMGATIQYRGVMPAHFFYTMQSAGKNSRFHELGLFETEPFSIGIAILFGVVVFWIIWHQRKGEMNPVYRKAGLVAFIVGAIALVMSTCYFPWDALQGLNRITGALIPMIQFPTRLTMIPTVCMTFVACAACVEMLHDRRTALKNGFFILLCSSCIIFSFYQTNDTLLQTEDMLKIHSMEGMGHTILLGGEYLPKDEEPDYRYHGAEASDGVEVEAFEKKDLDTKTTLSVKDDAEEYYVQLPMIYYKGYRAEDTETGMIFEIIPGLNGDVTVLLPAGYRGTLHTWYAGMWYWHIAEIISLITAVWMVFSFIRFRKSKEQRQ